MKTEKNGFTPLRVGKDIVIRDFFFRLHFSRAPRGGKNKLAIGFTLVEMLVVIAVIGMLAAFVFVALNGARGKTRVVRIRLDLKELRNAAGVLVGDTGQDPGHFGVAPCVQAAGGGEVYMDTPEAGINSTDGLFPAWNGPYLKGTVPFDQWGGRYMFDPDYLCRAGAIGCENIPDNTSVRAIYSGGENGSGLNVSDSDDIVEVMCR